MVDRINKLMQDKKPFLDPDLSIIDLSAQPTSVSIQICDSGARMVRDLGNATSVVGIKEICSDISQLKQGIYWVRIFTTNENFVNRFVKY